MFISLFLFEDLEILNTIILIGIIFFVFHIIGRIVQKIFSINTTNLRISIPLGFVFFCIINFIFYLPLIVFDSSLENYVRGLDYMRPILILLLGIVYYEEWWPRNLLKTKISIYSSFSIIFFLTFIIIAIFLNQTIHSFNDVQINIDSDVNNFFTSIVYSNHLNEFLSSNSYISSFYLYKWVYFIVLVTIFYLVISNWFKTLKFNKYTEMIISFFISFIFLMLFLIYSTSSQTLFLFTIILISFSLIKYYYFTWEKNINIFIISIITLASASTFSQEGLIFLITFVISTNIYQLNFKDKNKLILVSSLYIVFIFSFMYVYTIEILYAIIYAFGFLIFLVPFSISENKEVKETSNGLPYVIVFLALMALIVLVNLIYFSDSSLRSYLDLYYDVLNFNLIVSILLNTLFILIPVLFLYFYYLRNNKFSWMNILVIAYLIFYNPFSFVIFSNFFEMQIDTFNIILLFILIDVFIKLLSDFKFKVKRIVNEKRS